jgi:hypothetical protein
LEATNYIEPSLVCLFTGVLLQNPAVDQPEDSRLLSLLANVLEAMVDATEQREHARLHARLQVSPWVQLGLTEVQHDLLQAMQQHR